MRDGLASGNGSISFSPTAAEECLFAAKLLATLTHSYDLGALLREPELPSIDPEMIKEAARESEATAPLC